MRWLLILLVLPGCNSAISQVNKIDSLQFAAAKASDTTRINIYLEIATLYRRGNLDSMFQFANRALKLSAKRGYKKGEAQANLLMGISKWKEGDLLAGMDLCQAALDISVSYGLKKTEADALNNIGIIHNYQGNYPTAFEYYQKALSIAESLKNKTVTAAILINVGGMYYNLKDYDRALDYWKQTLDLQQQLGDQASAGSCMNNLGMVYADKGEYKMSLAYYFRSLQMYGYEGACARKYPLENIGNIYFKIKKLDSAEFYYKEALLGVELCNDPIIGIGINTGLATLYKATHQYEKALFHFEKAMRIGLKSGLNRETGIAAKSLSELHEELGHTSEAFSIFKTYHAIQDSIYNNENAKAIGKLEAQYEYESAKKEQRLENLEKERILSKEKWIRNTFIAGFVVMIFVALLVYRNFQRKKISNHRLRLLNKEIKKQQKVLISQAKQLQQLNKSLNELNSDLELKIADRTRELNDKNIELENKNIKLANYAFINAHKLRAPVATILGLVMLFDNKKVDNSERDEIVSMIKNCASELNNIVREIRVTLEIEKTEDK